MKKNLLTFLILLFCVQLAFAQNGSNAVRLNPNTEIVNTIFWNNPKFFPTSPGVVVSHSASDSLTVVDNNNIQLFSTPFIDGSHRVNSSSPVYNAGRRSILGVDDVLDLDYNSRVSCDSVDIGAYEYQVVTTSITSQPQNRRFCEGTPAQISVTAQGEELTFQWQRLVGSQWQNISGERQRTLIFQGNSSETGEYRVFVDGACCSDTSQVAQVIFDITPTVVTRDTTIVSGATVNLADLLRSSTGSAVLWFDNDGVFVDNPIISNITGTSLYVAHAQNGSCPDATGEAWIIVSGMPCVITMTRPDTTICDGETFRLTMVDYSNTFVEYSWLNMTAGGTAIPGGAAPVVRPSEATVYRAFGANTMGHECYADFTVNVHTVTFNVMPNESVCYWDNVVHLWSTPPATDWCFADGSGCIGGGNRDVSVLANQTTTLVAKYFDGTCEVSRTVNIYSNPPNLKAFPSDTTVCQGASIQLSTNVDPHLIKWKQRLSFGDIPGSGPEFTSWDPNTQAGPLFENLAPGTYIFEAWDWDILCGDVHDVVRITVQAKPEFNITSQPEVCLASSVTLMAEPNATYWTLLNGDRVFKPITMTADETYVGWYDDGVCLVSKTIDITVVATPTFTVRQDTTIDEGGSVLLWSSPNTAHWTALPSAYLGQGEQTVSPLTSTAYLAELYHVCGLFSRMVNVTVIETFKCEAERLSYDASTAYWCDASSSAVLTVTYNGVVAENITWTGNTHGWNFENGLTSISGNSITVTPQTLVNVPVGYFYNVTIFNGINQPCVLSGIVWVSFKEAIEENYTYQGEAFLCGAETLELNGVEGGDTYTWTLDDAPFATTRSITVTTAGTYKLVATFSTGCSVLESTIVVTQLSSADDIVPNVETIFGDAYCSLNYIVLVAKGGESFTWWSADRSISYGTGVRIAVPVPTAGIVTYLVDVAVTNGCAHSRTDTFHVHPINPLTCCNADLLSYEFVGSGTTDWCNLTTPVTVQITYAGTPVNTTNITWTGNTHNWNNPVAVSGGFEITAQEVIIGFVGYHYEITLPTCVDQVFTGIVWVRFQQAIITDNESSDMYFCNGDDLVLYGAEGGSNYAWRFNGSVIANSPTLTVTQAGEYTLNMISSTGCSLARTITVHEFNTTPQTFPVTAPCEATEVILTATGGNQYYWLGVSHTGAARIVPNVPATYQVLVLSGKENCGRIDTYVVEPCGLISIDDLNVTIERGFGCFENTGWANVIISGEVTTQPFSFFWTYNGAAMSWTESSRTNLAAGNYTIIVRDNVGSEVIKHFTLALAPPIRINFSVTEPTNEACSGGRIGTLVTGGSPPYSYWWDDNHIIDGPNRYNMDAGTYILTVTDSEGCQQKISIPLNCLFRRVMPTLFISPNGDGHNDFLAIQYIERYPINRVVILNSYGAQIRVFRNYNNDNVIWDGRNERGQILPDGVYYYIIEAQGLDQMVGWVLMKASKH